MIIDRLEVAFDTDLGGLFKGLEAAVDEAEAASRGIIAAAARMERQIEAGATRAGDAAMRFGDRLQSIGSRLSLAITVPVTALGAAAIKTALDFDLAMTGVAKTVDAPAAAIEEMGRQFKDMSETMPITAVELAGVAESAGQLGVAAGDIVGFTKVMADLGVSTDLSANEAADAIARFANITKMSLKDVDRLGSTIVALGNSGASTEREIASMGLRLAGAGSQIGLANSEILGFASALSSVGIEAEAGGSAFSKVFIQIATAVATGNDDLTTFAKVAGMSAAQFKQAFQQDASSAIISFIQGLSGLDSESGEVLLTLEALGIREVRMRDALLRATGASDMFTKSIQDANVAFEENTALTEEASKFYAADANRLKALWNEAVNVAGAFGEQMMPAFSAAITLAGKLLDVFDDMSPTTMNLVIGFSAAAAALGPVVVVIGAVIKLLPVLQASMGFLSAAGGPILLGVAAFGALVAAGLALVQNWQVISYEAGQLVKKVTGPFKEMYDKIVGHSYVPDMMDGIEEQFGRLPAIMTKKAQKEAAATERVFRTLHDAIEADLDVQAMMAKATRFMDAFGRKRRDIARGELGRFGASAVLGQAEAARKDNQAEAKRLHTLLPFGQKLTAQAPGPVGDVMPTKVDDLMAGLHQFGAGVKDAADYLAGGFSPAALGAAAIMEVFKGVMEPLQPIIDIVAGLLQAVGKVLGMALYPILKIVATAFSYVVQAIGWLVEGLGIFVDKLVPDFISKVGKGLAQQGRELQESAKAARRDMDATTGATESTDKLGKSADAAARSLGTATDNLPSWFRVNRAIYGATSPVPNTGGGSMAPQDNSLHIGTAVVQVQSGGPGESPTQLALKVVAGLKSLKQSGRTTDLDIMIAEAAAAV